jgi:cytochrome c oxidase subunit II
MKTSRNAFRSTVLFLTAIWIGSFLSAALAADPQGQEERTIQITAKKFAYSPNVIRIKTGVPVVLEFTSLDRTHGFSVPGLGGIRATIKPGKVTRVRIVAPKAGTYDFFCDVFCGAGHEEMTGKIIVED